MFKYNFERLENVKLDVQVSCDILYDKYEWI